MRTPLYWKHISHGARFLLFNNWVMPLHYPKGTVFEHQIVRKESGIFDVSHMGRIAIVGEDAETLLDSLSVNRLTRRADGSTTYTLFANAQGGTIDDLIVYKYHAEHFFIVTNAGNREKVLAHLRQESKPFKVEVSPCYNGEGILSLQGPLAMGLAKQIIPTLEELTPHHFLETTYLDKPLIAAGTGYTGAGGCEFFVPIASLEPLWDALVAAGAEPIGLGARDSLRLEMGYALYDHELSETIAPTESVAAWTVNGELRNFLGKAALQALEKSPTKRHAYGIRLLDKGIAREGHEVWKGEKKIGLVTSGGYSPSLNQAIALILVQEPLNSGDIVSIPIRETRADAKIATLPFYQPLK